MRQLRRLIEAAERGDLASVTAILRGQPQLINQRDESGATALHYAAFGGHRAVVQELVRQGADINATDSRFGATPAGWAIEYLREMGGFLATELSDLAYAIRRRDVEWGELRPDSNRFGDGLDAAEQENVTSDAQQEICGCSREGPRKRMRLRGDITCDDGRNDG
jgi:hypothetical protein